jgi:hypothetical protein
MFVAIQPPIAFGDLMRTVIPSFTSNQKLLKKSPLAKKPSLVVP